MHDTAVQALFDYFSSTAGVNDSFISGPGGCGTKPRSLPGSNFKCVPCPEPVLVDFLFHLKFQERERFCAGYVYYGRMTDAQIKTFATRCGRLMKDYGPVRPTLA